MLKKLMVLGGMLAMMLVVAAPAMSQTDEYRHSGTGVLGPSYTVGEEPEPFYSLTDETTGVAYELYSGFVELGGYVDQRVYFEGQQSQGIPPGPNEPIPVNVTYIEPVGTEGVETNAEVTGVISPNPDANIPGGEPTSHLIEEDGTGDIYMISSYGQGPDLASYEGQRVTIQGIFQTLGNPLSNFDDLTEVPIAVTSVEVLDDEPGEKPGNGGTEGRTIYGTEGPDDLADTPGNDTVYALGSGDTISSGYGDDILYGGTGWDYVVGGYGNDTLYGWKGSDWLDGGAGNDEVYGWTGDDYVDGGTGDDLVSGYSGNDAVYGFEGSDVLFGEDGNDFMYSAGDGTSDEVYGGRGYDTCVVDPEDTAYGCEELYRQ